MSLIIEFTSFLIDLFAAYLEWINEVGVDVLIKDSLNICKSIPKTFLRLATE